MAVKGQIVAGVATLAALYVGVSNALGLGDLELKSALNQPLHAVIEIPGSYGVMAEDVRVGLASAEAFERAGVAREHFLTGLRFTPVVEDGTLRVRIESQGPVREPFLNFLVELRQPSGRILREYTLLLDPPNYNPVTGRIDRPAPQAPTARASAAAPVATPQLPELEPAAGAGSYTTRAGDTLWKIASDTRPAESVDIQQNMLAIRALNPQAFVAGDMNRLRQDQQLVLPTAAQLGVADAVATTSGQIAAGLASTSGSNMPAQTAEPAETVAATPESAPVSEDDRLTIDALPDGMEGDAEVMQERLDMLETRFNVLLSELEDRDRQIAMLQAELEVLRADRPESSAAAESSEAEVIAAGRLDGPDQSGPSTPEGTPAPEAGSLTADPLPADAETSTAETAVDNTSNTQSPPQGFWRTWFWLPLLALLALLLALRLGWRRPRENDARSADEPTEMPRPQMSARPVVASQPKAAVDPLDGVELYLTYGRFTEARTMLDKAIADDPQRLELRYKQLRVLAELSDVDAFNQLAAETLEMGGEAAEVNALRERFPAMQPVSTKADDQVERVDKLDPLLGDDELDDPLELDDEPLVNDDADKGAMNLNDFSLDPDWDLINALESETVSKKKKPPVADTSDEDEEDFFSNLDQLPDVEELHDLDHKRDDLKGGSSH